MTRLMVAAATAAQRDLSPAGAQANGQICMDPLPEDTADWTPNMCTPCDHVFHEPCLRQWVYTREAARSQPACPHVSWAASRYGPLAVPRHGYHPPGDPGN